MRVSTRGTFLNGLDAMQRLQSALDMTQRQIASGRRILRPSDDPIASSQALNIREAISRLDQFDRNANIATSRLSQEETALKSANDVLQRVRELALQANNATQSDESRDLIAVELRERLDQLVQIANQQDGNGAYLFSGNLEGTAPVARSGSAFVYNGDQGQRFIQIGEGRQVSDGDSGADVFFAIRDGNGIFSARAATTNGGTGVVGSSSVTDLTSWIADQYTIQFVAPGNYEVRDSSAALVASGNFAPGETIAFNGVQVTLGGQPQTGDSFDISPSRNQDVFTTLDSLITVIEQDVSDDATRAAFNNAVNTGIQGIDQAIGSLLDVRTKVGSRLAIIEGQVDDNASRVLTYQETLSSLEDLDYAEALSRLSLEATTLEAAQQSFIRTQSLSLFNYF